MSDLSLIAGGDEHEAAVAEIAAMTENALERLLEQHPFFNNNQENNQK